MRSKSLMVFPCRIAGFWRGPRCLAFAQAEVVGPGWVTNEQFVAGYGAAQAVPGPLFTFAAYLGAVMGAEPNGWTGAFLTLVAIFLPSFLLVTGALPFWDLLRSVPVFQSALKGVNAAVVGLLLTALYTPVWTSAIHSPADFGLGLVAFRAPDVLEMSALAGGRVDRYWGRSDRAYLKTDWPDKTLKGIGLQCERWFRLNSQRGTETQMHICAIWFSSAIRERSSFSLSGFVTMTQLNDSSV